MSMVAPPTPREQAHETQAPRRPRNIIVVHDHGAIEGGSTQVAIRSACGLAQRGKRVRFLCAVGPPDPALAAAGVRVECLGDPEFIRDPNFARAAVSGLWKRGSAVALGKLLNGLDPADSLIHIHGWTKSLSASVLDAALSSGVATVVTLHDYFSVCPNGGFFNYQKQVPCGLQAMSASCVASNCDSRSFSHKLWRVARQKIMEQRTGAPQSLRHVIYVSAASRSILEPYFAEQTQWHLVRNAVDAPRGPRVPAETNSCLLFLGRLSPEKGADLLADAGQITGQSIRIVGEGDDRARIEKQWPRAALVGWLPRSGVQAELANARLLVFPSRARETQGMSVHEALACGVPVIVSDATSARDMVVEGMNGLLFRSGDAADLAAKIASLAHDDGRVKAMSQFSYEQYWRQPNSLDAHLDELIGAYDAIVADHAS
ncbi:MAG TPA: glycosyltransferase family 4 protein [Caulobacterales bacterium]|nr:glycosyltransferase family 4 protein [Caulobacterales bacterium]